jgi:hypothetical protein
MVLNTIDFYYVHIKFKMAATTGQWFTPVSSTNKSDRHDITEILLKVALSTINLNLDF